MPNLRAYFYDERSFYENRKLLGGALKPIEIHIDCMKTSYLFSLVKNKRKCACESTIVC